MEIPYLRYTCHRKSDVTKKLNVKWSIEETFFLFTHEEIIGIFNLHLIIHKSEITRCIDVNLRKYGTNKDI